MSQFKNLNRVALKYIRSNNEFNLPWKTMKELESSVNSQIKLLRNKRAELAVKSNFFLRFREWLDRCIMTDRTEFLDEPGFPEKTKLSILQGLHRMNVIFRSYHRFLGILGPLVKEISMREGRPARLLELASGSGEFTLALASRAKKLGLPLDITGSDYIRAHVESAKVKADKRGANVKFRVVNAFDMEGIKDREYDIIFIAQTLHHFTPGQLAMMIACSRRCASTVFIGVDGFRSLPIMFIVSFMAALTLRYPHIHDAVITSRKLYPEAELELVGNIAAPDNMVKVYTYLPGFSVLSVRFY